MQKLVSRYIEIKMELYEKNYNAFFANLEAQILKCNLHNFDEWKIFYKIHHQSCVQDTFNAVQIDKIVLKTAE